MQPGGHLLLVGCAVASRLMRRGVSPCFGDTAQASERAAAAEAELLLYVRVRGGR